MEVKIISTGRLELDVIIYLKGLALSKWQLLLLFLIYPFTHQICDQESEDMRSGFSPGTWLCALGPHLTFFSLSVFICQTGKNTPLLRLPIMVVLSTN